jgi:dihydrofolate reductase
MQAADTLLLGRVTYQGFAAAFASSTGPDAEAMNAYRKYVVSTTLEQADWANSSLIKSNVVDEITRLKQQEGQDIGMSGSSTLVQFLLRHNLIDELNLLIYPVVLGRGKRLFEDGVKSNLKLKQSKTSSSGVLLTTYQVVSA